MPARAPRSRVPPRVRIKTPPLLFEKTQALLARTQKQVDGTLLSYWTSTSGSVCDNDVMALQAILEARGRQERIALMVKSDGGSGMAALRLVHLYADRRSPKFERAALRWLERYLAESSPRLQNVAEVTASLARREHEAGEPI